MIAIERHKIFHLVGVVQQAQLVVQLVEGAVGEVAGQQVLSQPAAPLQHQPHLHKIRRGEHGRRHQDDARVLPQRAIETACPQALHQHNQHAEHAARSTFQRGVHGRLDMA